MTDFMYKGQRYTFAGMPTLGEMSYIERKIGADANAMFGMERILAGYFISVRRGRIAAGQPVPSWEEIADSGPNEFEDIPEPPPLVEPVAETPESEWPVDPKDEETPTEASGEYDQTLRAMDPGRPNAKSISLSSRSTSDSPPPRLIS